MAKEPSSNSSNAAAAPSSAVESFIGSFISVMSKSEIRYEGVLYFLNPQDATFGLKDDFKNDLKLAGLKDEWHYVRSFGTEGRRQDGQEVPPSDKVFEYILFRGSDIKDLKVITNPPVQKQEKLYDDPAIIESNYHVPPSSSSNSISGVPGYSTESKLHSISEPSGLNSRPYVSMLPLDPSESQTGWGSSLSAHSGVSSLDTPTQWQGYSAAPGSTFAAQQRPLSSTSMSYPLQNQASATMAVTDTSDFVPSGCQRETSGSICLNSSQNPTSEQLPLTMSYVNSLPSNPSQTFQNSTFINPKGLAQSFPLAHQNACSIETQVFNQAVPNSVSSLPSQFLPYSSSSLSGPMSNSSIGAPNLSQPRQSEYSLSYNLYADQKDAAGINSVSLNFLSSASVPAVQPPLLPLPPASQKLQSPLQFTEEFDFEAMNEKFKKDEVWGYLGKANQSENIDGTQSATTSQKFGEDRQAAYNKDDFFDTISCHSVGRGTRDGQNRSSERVKLDSETFGYYQRRNHFGYGGQRGGYGQHRGPYNWGRGYNYGYRGRGRYM